MKLIKAKKIENCYDGSMIYEYEFSGEVEEGLMKDLAKMGSLNYYPEFLRPFFKINTVSGLQVKGILGQRSFQVVYPHRQKWGEKKAFDQQLLRYLAGGPQKLGGKPAEERNERIS